MWQEHMEVGNHYLKNSLENILDEWLAELITTTSSSEPENVPAEPISISETGVHIVYSTLRLSQKIFCTEWSISVAWMKAD